MSFYSNTKKNGWTIVHLIINPLYTEGVLMMFLFFFSSKKHLQPFVDYMNNQHRYVKFTSKTEQNNTFSFLDINITRQNNQLKTSLYRKPTFSGVLTHNGSYIDQSYNKSLIFYFVISLLYYLLGLHTIPFGS